MGSWGFRCPLGVWLRRKLISCAQAFEARFKLSVSCALSYFKYRDASVLIVPDSASPYSTCDAGSTHVFHHMFSDGPCYKAVEATVYLKAYLEPRGLYNYDSRPTWLALWQTAKRCHYVEGMTKKNFARPMSDRWRLAQTSRSL